MWSNLVIRMTQHNGDTNVTQYEKVRQPQPQGKNNRKANMTQLKKVKQPQPQETNNKKLGMTHPSTVWQPQPQEMNNRKSGMTHPCTVWLPQPRQRNKGKIWDESHILAQTVINRGVIQDPPQEYKRAAHKPSGNQFAGDHRRSPPLLLHKLTVRNIIQFIVDPSPLLSL